MKPIKILHTSDWHIGSSICRKSRQEEHKFFLDWLIGVINREEAEVLIVSGDIFDSAAPGLRALKLYYDFLVEITKSSCKNVVIISGNHDSPLLLSANARLLESFGIHVITDSSPEKQALLLRDENGTPIAVVGAVPFLREGDVRSSFEGEPIDSREKRLAEGIKSHFLKVLDIARDMRNVQDQWIPLIITGHLFCVGAKTGDVSNERNLYVGWLGEVECPFESGDVDYLALGHIHRAQVLSKNDRFRYCGAPLPMGLKEGNAQKSVVSVQLSKGNCHIEEIPVPSFQRMVSLKGARQEIKSQVEALKEDNVSVWVEVILEDHGMEGDLSSWVEELTMGSKVEILQVHTPKRSGSIQSEFIEDLADLSATEVFRRLLEAKNVPQEQREDLSLLYQEVLYDIEAGAEEDDLH